jgi:hypothetical protein
MMPDNAQVFYPYVRNPEDEIESEPRTFCGSCRRSAVVMIDESFSKEIASRPNFTATAVDLVGRTICLFCLHVADANDFDGCEDCSAWVALPARYCPNCIPHWDTYDGLH